MAKQPATDAIMAADKLKPMLALSKREPVNAAIGMTADGDGFILLDKKAKPKTVVSMLKSTAAKAKLQLNPSSIRYGRAEVDTDYDAGMVRFFINKEAPGVLRVKLVEVVKRIAYQKVELNIDPSIDDEPETEEDGEQGQTTATAPTPEAPPLPTPGLDAAALKHALAGLIGRINQTAGDDATRKTSLMQLAGAANEALKGTDLAVASAAVDHLREALDGGPTQGTPTQGTTNGSTTGPNPTAAEVLREALADWQAHRGTSIAALKAVAGQIAAAKHESSAKAIIELQAVIKNLTAEPSTLQQVTELQNWLSTDEVVEDVCDLAEDVRTPLLESLQRLHDRLTT